MNIKNKVVKYNIIFFKKNILYYIILYKHKITNKMSTRKLLNNNKNIFEEIPNRNSRNILTEIMNEIEPEKYKKLECLVNNIHPLLKEYFITLSYNMYHSFYFKNFIICKINQFIDIIEITENANQKCELSIPKKCLLIDNNASKLARKIIQSTKKITSSIRSLAINLPLTVTTGALSVASITKPVASHMLYNQTRLYVMSNPYKLIVELSILPYMTYNMRNIFLLDSIYNMDPLDILKAGYSLFILNNIKLTHPEKISNREINIYIDYIQKFLSNIGLMDKKIERLNESFFNQFRPGLNNNRQLSGGSKKKLKKNNKKIIKKNLNF